VLVKQAKKDDQSTGLSFSRIRSDLDLAGLSVTHNAAMNFSSDEDNEDETVDGEQSSGSDDIQAPPGPIWERDEEPLTTSSHPTTASATIPEYSDYDGSDTNGNSEPGLKLRAIWTTTTTTAAAAAATNSEQKTSRSQEQFVLDLTRWVDPHPLVVYPDTTTTRVVDIFQNLGVSACLVISFKGKLVGFVKKIDILLHLENAGSHPSFLRYQGAEDPDHRPLLSKQARMKAYDSFGSAEQAETLV
jgi:hypothetical protein